MTKDAELHESVGAFALDALEADEVEAFERHLDACPRCCAEVRDHRETAAYLAHAGATAPDGVWDRIASQLEEAPEHVGAIIPIFARTAAPERSHSRRWRRATVAAATTAAALIAVNSFVLLNQRDRLNRIDPSSASSVQGFADRAATAKDSRVATLRQHDGTAVADIVITEDGRGYLTRGQFAAIDAARTYQLWALTDKGPVSLGVLGRKPIARVFSAQLPITRFAVTVEPVGGSTVPTSLPFVTGELQ